MLEVTGFIIRLESGSWGLSNAKWKRVAVVDVSGAFLGQRVISGRLMTVLKGNDGHVYASDPQSVKRARL